MRNLTHFNNHGDAHMVDITEKKISTRTAIASGKVSMSPESLHQAFKRSSKKGDVIGVARLSGIMAAKKNF
jgi:cyclic pyranopterin phosphate synthase